MSEPTDSQFLEASAPTPAAVEEISPGSKTPGKPAHGTGTLKGCKNGSHPGKRDASVLQSMPCLNPPRSGERSQWLNPPRSGALRLSGSGNPSQTVRIAPSRRSGDALKPGRLAARANRP